MKKYNFLLVMLIVACFIIGGYYYYVNKTSDEPTSEDVTSDLEQVLYKDMSTSYPATPRAVVEFYSRILMCLYNDEYTDEQFKTLGMQERKLFDEELLKNNPEDKFFSDLSKDVDLYHDRKQTIVSYTVDDIDNVEYFKHEKSECAGLKASYFMKMDSEAFEKVFHQYLLRKDEEGNWKIYGYYAVSSEDATGENE